MNDGLFEEEPKTEGNLKSSMAKNLNQLSKYTTAGSRNNSENINDSEFQSQSMGISEFGFGQVKESEGFEEVNNKDKVNIEMGWKDYMVEMEKAFRSMQVSLDAFKK